MPKSKSSSQSGSKPKKTKKSKEPSDEVDPEDFAQISLDEETKEKKTRGRPKKVVELRDESPDEDEEEIYHICGECQKEFTCADGKFGKSGKFKCSCIKEKDGSDVYFFCSEECREGASGDEDAPGGEDEEDQGYVTV